MKNLLHRRRRKSLSSRFILCLFKQQRLEETPDGGGYAFLTLESTLSD
jgi:hypothetical protein